MIKDSRRKTSITKDLDEFGEVIFSAETIIQNDGIGHYEFWGQKCYDAGDNYAIVDGDVTWEDPEGRYDFYDKKFLQDYIKEHEDDLYDEIAEERNKNLNDD